MTTRQKSQVTCVEAAFDSSQSLKIMNIPQDSHLYLIEVRFVQPSTTYIRLGFREVLEMFSRLMWSLPSCRMATIVLRILHETLLHFPGVVVRRRKKKRWEFPKLLIQTFGLLSLNIIFTYF